MNSLSPNGLRNRPGCWTVRTFTLRLAILCGMGLFSLCGDEVSSTNPPDALPAVATSASSLALVSPPIAAQSRATNEPAILLAPLTPRATNQSAFDQSFDGAGELLVSSNLLPVAGISSHDRLRHLHEELDLARQERRNKNFTIATKRLAVVLDSEAGAEIKRVVLLELAMTMQDANQPAKALQSYAQYLRQFPQDPFVPEVLLRQGLLHRQMGANTLAVSKFYAVMTTALHLKLERLEYYQRLVLQAQTEIADTYFLDGRYAEAADFFARLLKLDAPELNKAHVQFKLIRCYAFLGRHTEVVAQAQIHVERYANSAELPEVRFLLASSLQKLGRSRDALHQVLLLLEAQQNATRQNPETWVYWQQRAGNEIANHFYKEGDYLNALEIYLNLAELDRSPTWQLPVWYQIGLAYERLQQPQKASETYDRIIARQRELPADTTSPSLRALIDMAKWRKDYLAWLDKAEKSTQSFHTVATNTNLPPLAVR